MNVTIPYSVPDTSTIWRAHWDPLAFTGTHAAAAWLFVIASSFIIASLWALATVGYNKNLASWQKPRRWGLPVAIGTLTWAVCAWLVASYFIANQTTQVSLNVPHTVGTTYRPTTNASASALANFGATRHDINVTSADSLIRSSIVMTYGFTVTSKEPLGNTINPHSPIDSAKLAATASDGSTVTCTLSKTGDVGKDKFGRAAKAAMRLDCNN